MERVRVHSSSIAEIGFDPEARTLEVLFHGGTLYRYFGVPPRVSIEFLESDSHGRYFQTKIRGRYRYERLGRHRF
jgi:hypothetical protein